MADDLLVDIMDYILCLLPRNQKEYMVEALVRLVAVATETVKGKSYLLKIGGKCYTKLYKWLPELDVCTT